MANKVSICGIDTNTLPKVSAKEMLALLKEASSGNKDAREMCIVYNMRLVLSIVHRFNLEPQMVDDVFQVGVVGLIKAIDNFNHELAVQFSTYAVPMIVGEIKRHLTSKSSIKVSRSTRDTAYRALEAKNSLEKNSSDEVTILDIANKINEKPATVSTALQAIMDPVSIFDSVYDNNGDTLMLLDQIKDTKSTEDSVIEKSVLSSSLKNLPRKEREILTYRYFLGKTQTEISELIGISQAQVSRLEKNALKELYTELV